jgi:hypothetical protein
MTKVRMMFWFVAFLSGAAAWLGMERWLSFREGWR